MKHMRIQISKNVTPQLKKLLQEQKSHTLTLLLMKKYILQMMVYLFRKNNLFHKTYLILLFYNSAD